MALTFSPAPLKKLLLLLLRRPLFRYAAAWTALMTTAVAVTSLAPELAFVWAVRPSSSSSSSSARACSGIAGALFNGQEAAAAAFTRIPIEGPTWEVVCVPAKLLRRSAADLVVPPLFAALVVGGATWLVRAAALWESDVDDLDALL